MPSELEQESAGAAGLPRCGLLCTRARRMLVGAQSGAVQLLCSPTAASTRARTYLDADSMVRAAAGTWRGQQKSVCGRAVWSFPLLPAENQFRRNEIVPDLMLPFSVKTSVWECHHRVPRHLSPLWTCRGCFFSCFRWRPLRRYITAGSFWKLPGVTDVTDNLPYGKSTTSALPFTLD